MPIVTLSSLASLDMDEGRAASFVGLSRAAMAILLACGLTSCAQRDVNSSTVDAELPPQSKDAAVQADLGGVDVDQVGACSGAPPLTECVVGAVFADCGGQGQPGASCKPLDPARPNDARCRWFTGGCPADGYTIPCEAPGGPECPIGRATDGWGSTPWDRDRGFALDVIFDSTINAEAASLACMRPCGTVDGIAIPDGWPGGQCMPAGDLCSIDGLIRLRACVQSVATIRVTSTTASTIGTLFALELDLERMQARTCGLIHADVPVSGAEAFCASSGTVSLSGNFDSFETLQNIQLKFEAEFPTFSPWPATFEPFITGLMIQGSIDGAELSEYCE